MKIELTSAEKKALIWQEGDFLECRSGTFCITRSEPKVHFPSWKFIHFKFDEESTGNGFSGDMGISGDFPNGKTLMVLYRRGDQIAPYGLISMNNHAWVCQAPIGDIKLLKTTARYKRLYQPSLVQAFGLVAQVLWDAGTTLFTNNAAESKEIEAALHDFMHRISRNAEQYWEGHGEQATGRL